MEKQMNADVYYRRGVAKWELGDYKGAFADFDKAIIINRGTAKKKRGDYSGAKEDCNKGAEINNKEFP